MTERHTQQGHPEPVTRYVGSTVLGAARVVLPQHDYTWGRSRARWARRIPSIVDESKPGPKPRRQARRIRIPDTSVSGNGSQSPVVEPETPTYPVSEPTIRPAYPVSQPVAYPSRRVLAPHMSAREALADLLDEFCVSGNGSS